MTTADGEGVPYALNPIKGGAPYTMTLQEEMLSLLADDGHTVMMLPRGEAARYMHFEWDLRRGRVIEFRLLGGLRSMRFVSPAAATAALTAWLPLGETWTFPEHSALVLIAGVAGFAWPPVRVIGAMVFVTGVLNLLPLRRNLALLNAIMCGTGAAVSLFGPALGHLYTFPAGAYLYGALLAVAAIEQLGHLGPNHFVFASRRAAVHLGATWHSSVLVKRVAYIAASSSLAFAGLAGVVYYAPLVPAPPDQAFSDAPVFLLAALALAAPVPLLLWRRRPPYGEALLVAQFLIAVTTVLVWGIANLLLIHRAADYTGDAFAAAVSGTSPPYFAAPLLLLEWAFRRRFVREAEREAAEAD